MFSRAVSCSLALAILSTSILHADESVRSTQEELRRRNLYFGDIDGKRSSEYEEAVRRYQKKKGFSSSGREDPETLRSLGLLPRSPNEAPPKELQWPEEPVLKSDTHINVPQEAHELSLATGVAPESIGSLEPWATGHTGRRGTKFTAGSLHAGGGGAPVAETAPRGSQIVTRDDVVDLIKRYLHAVSRGDLKEELSLYADHVDYFGNGQVDRRIIEHLLHKYYAQWPNRSYSLAKITGYSRDPRAGVITVNYDVSFSLKNSHGRAKGMTENRIVINAATSNPRIVSIQEQRVRPSH